PVTLRVMLPQGDARHLKTMTLVIDDNPAPVAATFKIADNAGVSTISTRVRVNSYTNVHAVAELSDGRLYMVKTYVKASGGCAARCCSAWRAGSPSPRIPISASTSGRMARQLSASKPGIPTARSIAVNGRPARARCRLPHVLEAADFRFRLRAAQVVDGGLC